MKNLVLCLTLLIELSLTAWLQAQPDLQWFILDSLGKVGTDANSPPENRYQIPIDNDTFNISGFFHPQSIRGKNDFLVIYSDGTHFNSRGDASFFPKPAQLPSPTQSHNFVVPSGKRIVALYTTRNYEGDDPPDKVKLTNRPDPAALSYPLGMTSGDSLLTASHAVVRNRDITLMVNLDSLRTAIEPLYSNQFQSASPPFILSYTLIRNNGSPVSVQGDHFLEANSFLGKSTAWLPQNACSKTQGASSFTINANAPSPFLYLNLRPSHVLNDYFSDEFGNQAFKILFELKNSGGTTIATLQEPLLEAFDPNVLIVKGVCSTISSRKWVEYAIEFENTGTKAVTSNLSVTLQFPEHIIDVCTSSSTWVIGGQAHPVVVTKENCNLIGTNCRTFRLTPQGDYTLEGCGSILNMPSATNPALCKSLLILKVKLREDQEISFSNLYPINLLIPENCMVDFGNKPDTIDIKTKTEALLNAGPYRSNIEIPRIVQASLCRDCDTIWGWVNKNPRLTLALAIAAIAAASGIRMIWKPKIPQPGKTNN